MGDDEFGAVVNYLSLGDLQALGDSEGAVSNYRRSVELYGAPLTAECFPAGVSIADESGKSRPIESLRIGDSVAAFDSDRFNRRGGFRHKLVFVLC